MSQGQVARHTGVSWFDCKVRDAHFGKAPIAILSLAEVEAAGIAHGMQMLQAICLPYYFPQSKATQMLLECSHHGRYQLSPSHAHRVDSVVPHNYVQPNRGICLPDRGVGQQWRITASDALHQFRT